MTNIVQGTDEWLEAKQETIGGSEIYSLIHHYCAKELQEMGFNLFKEKPFRTVQEMFLKVFFDAKLGSIDPVFSEFGNGMESFIAYKLGKELPMLNIERTKDFIINESFNNLAACSPDGYCEFQDNNSSLQDFDETCTISKANGRGLLEFKTANYFAGFEEGGSKLQYIIQLQYNMMISRCNWGILAVITPKQESYDEPFFKGRMLEKVESSKLEEVNQYYDMQHYIYPVLPVFQGLITKALIMFKRDLDGYKEGRQECFPRNSEDREGLEREKTLWAQLWPEHYGIKELEEDDELNALLNERAVAQEQTKFADTRFKEINNEILQRIKAFGYDKFVEIKGTENRAQFIKNGQLRFYKNKNV